MELSNEEVLRYSRQMILPEVGPEGQSKLKAASVLCVGAGGLGSPVALYLAAAGVGTIGVLDFDAVDLSNLQRQILHRSEAVGRPKTESARAALQGLNPGVNVVTHNVRLDRSNALDILKNYDVVVDGTDNFPTRYLTNDACVLLGKPNIYGSIFRFEGQASLFAPHLGGPCYRCLYPEPPTPGTVPSCAEGGVLGVLPGLVGSIQAAETLKLILGKGTSLLNRLLLINVLDMTFRELKLQRDPACPLCGDHRTITELADYESVCRVPPGDGAPDDEVTVQQTRRALANPASGVKVLDVRERAEYAIARIPGAMLLPLSELSTRFAELDPNREYYLHCKAGIRSRQAMGFLHAHGFKHLKNVKGGILAWSEEIDPQVPKY